MGYPKNRATWQILRRTVTNPHSGSSSTVPTIGMNMIATYVGTKVPVTVASQDIPGAAFELIDFYAFVAAQAVSVVQHRDTMVHVETQDRFEVVKIQGFPNVCQISLRQIKGKSVAVSS